tara:strand:+ start:2392 stop:11643 length:9252 start_codon:yes stop_codon:yes gene_type:complete
MIKESNSRRTAAAILLVIMFLSADILVTQTSFETPILEDSDNVQNSIRNVVASSMVHISSEDVNTNFAGGAFVLNSLVGVNATDEARSLINFNNTVNSNDTIQSAILSMHCNDVYAPNTISAINLYAASVEKSWRSTESTWINSDSTTFWQTAGGDDVSSDRSGWEIPASKTQISTSGVYNYSFNVTKLVQQDSIDNKTTFDFILSAVGGMLQCVQTTQIYPPYIAIETSSVTPGDGGSVTSDFVADGMPLMSNDFLLTAETNPTLSYSNLNGSHVEFQLSLGEDFRNRTDLDWVYSTLNDPFTTTLNSGSFTIPQSDSIQNGSIIHYRSRSLDSSGMISNWSSGHFLLPNLEVTDNRDGTATINANASSINLGTLELIEDVEVDSSTPNSQLGLSDTLTVQSDTTTESIVHTRLNTQYLGLNSSLAIISAGIEFTRTSPPLSSSMLSLHHNSDMDWNEEEANWRYANNSAAWDDGGIDEVGIASTTILMGAQTSQRFSFAIEDVIQSSLNNPAHGGLEFTLLSRLGDESFSTSVNGIDFASTENSDNTIQPQFQLTYIQSPNSLVPNPELLTPTDGSPVWNLTGDNISANTIPTMTWNATLSGNYDMLFQLSEDKLFRNLIFNNDSTGSNPIASSSGLFAIPHNMALDEGKMYFWRMLNTDNTGRLSEWQYSSFLVSSLSSTWLGGDRYEMTLEFGTEALEESVPNCHETTLSSLFPNSNDFGSPRMRVVDDQFQGVGTSLFQCDVSNYLLPSGYAVESSQIELQLDSYSNPIDIGVWEAFQHNWTATGATWDSYDGTNLWNSSGASGTEKGQLLDTQMITNSASQGDIVSWNITSATQKSMRDDTPLDLIFNTITSTTSSSTAFYSSLESVQTRHPSLKFVYIPGSSQLPDIPTLDEPLNGEWLYTSEFTLASLTLPVLNWTDNGAGNVIGWALELDTSNSFSSNELQTFTSWNEVGFDLSQTSFEIQNDLDTGKQWFWRVRALSPTYQLGDWSSVSHFYLADLDTTTLDADHFTMNLRPGEVMPHISIPHFEDTYVSDDGSIVSLSQGSDSDLKVGTSNVGDNFSGLIQIDIDSQIQPNNGRLISANLNLYSSPIFSTTNLPIAVRPVLQPWTDQATSLLYNGTNTSSWSSPGGRDIGVDIGVIEDIQISSHGWMAWNVTNMAQQAIFSGNDLLSIMLYNTNPVQGQVVSFSSVDSLINQPYLELVWANGSVTPSQEYPGNDYPADGQIVWDSSTHSLVADKTPTFQWSMPASSNFTPDAWRLFIDNNLSDEMEGQIVFDSRVNPSNFDLVNLEFDVPYDLDFSNHIQWSVQGIEDGMIGYTSNKTTYWLPQEISQEESSIDAWANFQEGSIVEELNFPLITADTYLDQDDPNSAKDGQGLYVGVSPTNSSAIVSSLISFDFSSLPMPNEYEIMVARLELTQKSNITGLEDFYCSDTFTAWDDSSTWNSPSAGSNWIEPGAFHSLDSELPFPAAKFMSFDDENFCDVTHILQRAIANGDESMSVIIQPEFDDNDDIVGQYLFADSEDFNTSDRPNLYIEYRTTAPWVPIAPLLNTPADGATLWNYSSPIPRNVDSIDFSFTQSNNNATNWDLCFSSDQRIYSCPLAVIEGDDSIEGDWEWDSSTNTISFNNITHIDDYGDEWFYWKVLSIQDHRIGEFSAVNKYRVPSDQGFDDGTGNYSYELSRASVFELTGVLPQVLDASIDSNSQVNTGSSSALTLGYDASTGGNSDILLDFDLSQIPWPSAITPTSMILEMNLISTGTSSSPLTVSAYACSTFNEMTLTSANAPSCSNNEITRTTLTSNSNGVVEWDLTALGQSNFANGNFSFTIILDAENVSSSYDFVTSEGAATLQPKLVLEYVDNIGGVLPPSQPILNTPIDGTVLYDVSSEIISSVDSVTLSWSPSTGASSYILFLSDSSGITTFDSRFDSEISGNTFTTSSSLNVGEVYTWWVKGINQNIPGPSSSRWNFAVGDPVHYYDNDGTYVYEFQDASEVEDFGHVEIRDAGINDAFADSNYGSLDTMVLGTGCEGVSGSLCYGVISLDASQVPLDVSQSVHSVDLTLFVESWDLSGGAYEIEFSVHEFLDSSWNEYGITWNTTGVNPGLTAGVDYNATALDIQTFTSTDFELTFEIGVPGMLVDDERHWIIIANPISTGTVLDGLVSVYSSDASTEQDYKPLLQIHTTNVSALNVTATTTTFDADTPVLFEVISFDQFGVANNPYIPIGGYIEWSTTSGSIAPINSTMATMTPSTSGLQTVTACYGVICSDFDLIIAPGIPVQLIASLDNNNQLSEQTITADETVEIYSSVLDQFSNVVTSQTINYYSTNGSMTGTVFYPYSVGTQTLTAQWNGVTNSLSVDLTVIVVPGAPDRIELSGCEMILESGTSCSVYATTFDQFENLVWFDDTGGYSFSTTNGNFVKVQTPTPHSQPPAADILVGDYTGISVGTSTIAISTSTGLTYSIDIEVTYGEMASLELIASSETITADDTLEINATRIDINGNRLAVSIPLENWTQLADGNLTEGIPHIWVPTFQGTKTLTVTYESFTEDVTVFVSRGLIDKLELRVNDQVSNDFLFNITADQSIEASVKAFDSKGNIWYPLVDWSISHSTWANQSELTDTSNSTDTIFSPVHESIESYVLMTTYYEQGLTHESQIYIIVSKGDLDNFVISATDASGAAPSSQDGFSITADESVSFSSELSDFDGNSYDQSVLTWILVNQSNGLESDITALLVQNDMVWEASVAGDWQIYAYSINNRGQNLTSSFDIIVANGVALYIEIVASATSQDSGGDISLLVFGYDTDGNKFPQAVSWKENDNLPYNINSTDNYAEYIFNGRVSGNYSLSAIYAASTDVVDVTVYSLSIPKYITVNVSKTTLEQLESLSISVVAFDEYWNIIDVPASSRVEASGRGEVINNGQGNWKIETLEEGKQTATITVGSVSKEVNYTVEGNIAGLFAAGGSLYYVGAGLVILIALAVVAVGFRFMRGNDEYYDDEDDYDYNYDVDSVVASTAASSQEARPPSSPPTKPEPAQQETEPEPEQHSDETEDWMIDYRIEDDGTEWGQADDQVWFYRESGQSEWVEWDE